MTAQLQSRHMAGYLRPRHKSESQLAAQQLQSVKEIKLTSLASATKKRATAQALRESQACFFSAIENVGEGMVVVQDGQIVFANRKVAGIFEMDHSRIIEDGLLQHVHWDDRAAFAERLFASSRGENTPDQISIRFTVANKKVKFLEVGTSSLVWNERPGSLIFFTDVTAVRQAQELSNAAELQQIRLDTLRTKFLTMTNHVFRTPLAKILSAHELLQNYGDRLALDEKDELFNITKCSVLNATVMLDRIMLLSQAEARTLVCNPKPLDLAAFVKELVLANSNRYPRSVCEIVTEFPSGVVNGFFDEGLLRNILDDLLSNAIIYSPAGGVVQLRVYRQQQQTVFEVSDRGIGIPSEDIENVFEPFHRASNAANVVGNGLGLAIVKQLVALLGGTVDIRSVIDEGTLIRVTLPALNNYVS